MATDGRDEVTVEAALTSSGYGAPRRPWCPFNVDLCQTRTVRRGLAGLLFFIAAILLAIAAGGWWLQRVAFDPATSRGVADVILEDEDLRAEVATRVATAASERVAVPVDQLSVQIAAWLPLMADDQAAGPVVDEIITQAQQRLIGERDEPVTITGQQMVQLVRNENAFDLPAVELPVQQISWLSMVRQVLTWLVPIAAVAGLLAVVLGILAHPNRADAVFGLGVFCVVAAVLAFLFGYVVPAYAITPLTDEPWAALIPAVAQSKVELVAGLSVALAIIGSILVFATVGVGRRKTKGWSAPVRRTSYQSEQRQWSR